MCIRDRGKKGAIVNTASMSGTIVNIPQRQVAYNSTKAAVVHLTKTLAVELSLIHISIQPDGSVMQCVLPRLSWNVIRIPVQPE